MLYDVLGAKTRDPHQIPLVQLAALCSLAVEYRSTISARERGQLECHSCRNVHLHLLATGTHQGRVVTLLGRTGVHVVGEIHNDPDGAAIIVIYQCECCHMVTIELTRERKGSCYRSSVMVAPANLARTASDIAEGRP